MRHERYHHKLLRNTITTDHYGIVDQAVDSIEEEIDASVILRRRIDHLTPYDPVKMSVDDLSRWRSDRLNRMLVDHLLRNGYYDTATQLARKNQIEVSTT